MAEERVLNEAQISMGVSLPLNHKDVLKMFFVMVGRGIPVAEVIDILAEILDIKAPAKQQWEHILPERECLGCGIRFQPLSLQQTYHNVHCQQDATARRQSDKTRQKHLDYVAALQDKADVEAALNEAEKEAVAEGYEFEAIPDGHPRWALPADLRRSSASNRKWPEFVRDPSRP